MKKVVIVGGGTAGWLTALYAQRFWGMNDITLIESSKIGILGAGEGSTPNFPGIIADLGIDENDFIIRTDTVLKKGIDFVNWSPDKSSEFLHDFGKLNNNKVYGYHFNAKLVAEYFKNIALERSINWIDSVITGFNKDSDDNIKDIELETGDIIPTDFVFDCSGFARLVIGNEYKSEWISYADQLTTNSAIAFFEPMNDTFELREQANTKCIAMNAGWMWRIPTRGRYGNGYAFSDKYISVDEAKAEIETYLGRPIEIVKTFKYEAGHFKESWVKNCIAIGLSSGFLEPLEATAVMTLIMSLQFINKLGDDRFNDPLYVNQYNEYMEDINKQNMLFVRYHYHCYRSDTPFW
jgi:tryptophan halogenase